jgi:hypothetical protein
MVGALRGICALDRELRLRNVGGHCFAHLHAHPCSYRGTGGAVHQTRGALRCVHAVLHPSWVTLLIEKVRGRCGPLDEVGLTVLTSYCRLSQVHQVS